MNRRQFDYNPRRIGRAGPSPQEAQRLKWIPVSQINESLVGNAASKRGRKIFAVISPPVRVDQSNKPVRRILIFDNHPESLRLVSEKNPNKNVSSPKRRLLRREWLLGLLLILVLLVAFSPWLLS